MTVENYCPERQAEFLFSNKDQPILAAAITGKATHLITGDYKDFGKYFNKKIEGILILPPAEYLKHINSHKTSTT